MSATDRLRRSPDTAGHGSPVEEWFRLSTKQRAQQFHPPPVALAPGSPGEIDAAGGADLSPRRSSPPEESDSSDAPNDAQLRAIESSQFLAHEHIASSDTPTHDPRQVRGELLSLINSFRKTGPPDRAGWDAVPDRDASMEGRKEKGEPEPEGGEDGSSSSTDAPLTDTRKELLVLINSYRKTGDVSMPVQGDGSEVSVLEDGNVARGLDFEHLLDVSMHASANPSESVLVPAPSVKKSGAAASEALLGLSDVFADVSAVAEQRMQRGSPGRPLRSDATPQAPRPSAESEFASEQTAGEQFSAEVDVAGILFKELEALKQQLQDAKEEMDGDKTTNEPMVSASPGRGVADDSEATIQVPSNPHTAAEDLVVQSTTRRDDSLDVASLEHLSNRLHTVMNVVHNWISLSQLPETTAAVGDSAKLLQQQEIHDYIHSLARPDHRDQAREAVSSTSPAAHPSSPGSGNPDGPWVSPILKPDKRIFASPKLVSASSSVC